MKKITSIILMICALTALCVSANAATTEDESIVNETLMSEESAAMSLDEIMESFKVGMACHENSVQKISTYSSNIVYSVNAICDSYWITVMNNSGVGGLDAAEFIIDEISTKLEDWAGIEVVGYAKKGSFSCSSSDYRDHLDEAKDSYGTGSRDLMVAFSGVGTATVNVGGGAYVGDPYSILFLQSYSDMWKAGRHEVGHMFDTVQASTADSDQDCKNECFMNDDPYSNSRYNKICSSCKSGLKSNRSLYE